ncbi:AraC family transcriptional regulator [Bacillus sp. B1-b2]|uniref:AraC family transcriptional regulator n=1 Tax=Bacillus sp. B1-b2 TaxID=2653201 RepID=UPI001261FD25|nr:AraC family transcriptional regulator [Bacillus sp. B1-b2]KAB7667623.1 AraC family transcriptional regulator [Bacillus sp. B1-b2]
MYKHGVYGFRFLDGMDQSLYQLFAVGYEYITNTEYHWDGLQRTDGPLILFQYTVSGKGSLIVNGQLHEVSMGSAFMIDIPSNHQYFFNSSNDHWEFYFILFRPTKLETEWQFLSKELGVIFSLEEASPPVLLLKTMYLHAYNRNINDRYLASSMVYQFVMEIYRNSLNLHKEHDMPDHMKKAIRYIEENFTTVESVEEVAAVATLSKYYFTRLFKKITGFTPLQYVTKLRLEKAIKLLRDTDYTIEEIARMIGYANASYFIKVFRQWVGYSPGEYRLGKNHLAFTDMLFK